MSPQHIIAAILQNINQFSDATLSDIAKMSNEEFNEFVRNGFARKVYSEPSKTSD